MSNINSFVVFGYGSLIFKPPPYVIRRDPGFLKGYVRRFAQKSHDHRGTPEKPGRGVTLIHKEEWNQFSPSDKFPHDDIVWGVVYTIDHNYAEQVREMLDIREADGYTLEYIDVYGINSNGEEVVVSKNGSMRMSCPSSEKRCYVGRNDNPSFVYSEPLCLTASIIHTSVGPSGPNKEYLYKLAQSIRELSPNSFDSHLFALEKLVRGLDSTGSVHDSSVGIH